MEFSVADEELTILDNDEEPELTDFSMEDLLTMIRSLPDGYRIVFNLYVFEKVSHTGKLQSYFR